MRGTVSYTIPLNPNPYFLRHRFIGIPSGMIRRVIGPQPVFALSTDRAVYGDPGDNTIYGSNHHDYYLDGKEGNDTIDGGERSDWINGGPGNDMLLGGPGGDILYGHNGQDTMEGGAGNDHLRSRRFSIDQGRYVFAPGREYDFDGDNTLRGGADHDLLEGGFGNEALYGDDERDLTASGNDIVIGWSGNDLVDGGPGNDLLYGDHAQQAYLTFGSGTMRYHPLILELFPNWQGRQTFLRDGQYIPAYERSPDNGVNIPIYGNDVLRGGAGNDRLYGEAGNDILDGGADRDWLVGGPGNDTYIISDFLDTIVESVNGGIDTVEASVSHGLRVNVENLTLTGQRNLSGTGNSLSNRIQGNDGHNVLWGNLGNDSLLGQAGHDVLVGANVYGATPTNEIDTLTGNTGRDTFVLGIGNPGTRGWRGGSRPRVLYDDGISVFGGRSSYALITDFNNGEDLMQLRGRRQDYLLRTTTVVQGGRRVTGTGVFLNQLTDELIAVVQHGQGIGAGQLNLANNNQFTYV